MTATVTPLPRSATAGVGYNITTRAGRAAEHVLNNSAIRHDRGAGWGVTTLPDGGRRLVMHPSYEYRLSDGERSLFLLVYSLVESQPVCLSWLLGTLDDEQRQVVAEVVAMAAGCELVVV